ncbi:MAG TPA: fumarylacetoacetate hydrolase family protein [Stellaceae bacterium]
MKLATLRNTSPDGELVVVSRDLTKMASAADIAPSLRVAFDDWARNKPRLEERYGQLMSASLNNAQPFDAARCHSPLPRSFQWLDGTAYESHRYRMTRGRPAPEWFLKEPAVYQGRSDGFLAPTQDVPLANEDWGIDFEGEVAVVTDYVPYGASPSVAASKIELVMLVNDVSLRAVQAVELGKQFGFTRSKPASAFTPVCVTLDELGPAWRDNRLHLPIRCSINGKLFGDPDAGEAVHGFDVMVSYCAMTQALSAGTIVGGGTVSNQDLKRGFATIAEARSVEETSGGAAKTPFLKWGDRVRIEMNDAQGRSIFGAIDHKMARPS